MGNSLFFIVLTSQGCVLGTRVYIQEGIADKFVPHFTGAVRQIGATLKSKSSEMETILGRPFHTQQKEDGNAVHRQGKKDVTLLMGGKFLWRQRLLRAADTFKTEEEAIKKANYTEYGLGAYVYTSNMDQAFRVSKALEAVP